MDVRVGTSSVGVNGPEFRTNSLLNDDGIEGNDLGLTLGLYLTFSHDFLGTEKLYLNIFSLVFALDREAGSLHTVHARCTPQP